MGGKTVVGALIFGLIAVELMKRYIGVRQSTGDLYATPLALGIAIGRIGCFLTGLSDNTYGTPATLPWAINFGDGIPRHPTQLYELAFLLALIPILYRIVSRIVILCGAEVSRSETPAQSKACPELVEGDPSSAGGTGIASRHSLRARLPHFSRPLREVGILPTTNDQRPTTPFLPGDAFKFFMVSYLSFRLLCDFIKPYPRIFLGLGGIQWGCLLTLLYYSRDIARWLRQGRSAATSRT
jgi:phosphatidylglycerol:prolipoprotein diacylglycerol transferase